MLVQIAEFTVCRLRDIAWSVQRARLLGSLAGLPTQRRADLGKAVEHIVGRVVSDGKSGTIQFGLQTGQFGQMVEAVIHVPHGHPLSDCSPSAKTAEVFPDPSAGEYVDRLDVEPSTKGVTVRLAVAMPDGADPIAPEVASEWATAIATRSTRGALAGSQRRIGELADKLRQLTNVGSTCNASWRASRVSMKP